MRIRLLGATTLAVLVGAIPARSNPSGPPEDPGAAMVERFLAREDEPLASYTGHRCLEATNARFKASGSMQVTVTLTPERGFEWTVVREQGSSYIRNKVLRKALDSEREMVARGDPGRAALTLANYGIVSTPSSGSSPEDLGTLRLLLTPKRSDLLLVRGSVLVSDPEGDLLEVRGRLAKNPSWWTTAVEVVRTYGRVGGVRVPLTMSSTAQVRIAGRSQFRMTSTFEQVNGRTTGTAVTADSCATTTI